MKLIIEIDPDVTFNEDERRRLKKHIWPAIGQFADSSSKWEYRESDFKVYWEDD